MLQGRYKAILCQSDQYLGELVRYIHLNPVRAKMVRKPEDFAYSSHRAYVGLDEPWLVDVEPVLRHFGGSKKLARERFKVFVRAGMKMGHQEEFYRAEEGRILGSEEFVEQTRHRIGEIPRGARPKLYARTRFKREALIKAIERVTGLKRREFCIPKKTRDLVLIKEAMIMVGRELGASNADLARITGLDASVVSRRYESGRTRVDESREARQLVKRLREELGKGGKERVC